MAASDATDFTEFAATRSRRIGRAQVHAERRGKCDHDNIGSQCGDGVGEQGGPYASFSRYRQRQMGASLAVS
jgi:hypothetical protein